MQNNIIVKQGKTEYIEQNHLKIYIDNESLDKILSTLYPEKGLLGLVPTLFKWIEDDTEKELILARFNSLDKRAVLPILICPDDLDLWCTVVVVEVVKDQKKVLWNRIGLDRSTREDLIEDLDNIGKKVEWLTGFEKKQFEKDKYVQQLLKIYKDCE